MKKYSLVVHDLVDHSSLARGRLVEYVANRFELSTEVVGIKFKNLPFVLRNWVPEEEVDELRRELTELGAIAELLSDLGDISQLAKPEPPQKETPQPTAAPRPAKPPTDAAPPKQTKEADALDLGGVTSERITSSPSAAATKTSLPSGVSAPEVAPAPAPPDRSESPAAISTAVPEQADGPKIDASWLSFDDDAPPSTPQTAATQPEAQLESTNALPQVNDLSLSFDEPASSESPPKKEEAAAPVQSAPSATSIDLTLSDEPEVAPLVEEIADEPVADLDLNLRAETPTEAPPPQPETTAPPRAAATAPAKNARPASATKEPLASPPPPATKPPHATADAETNEQTAPVGAPPSPPAEQATTAQPHRARASDLDSEEEGEELQPEEFTQFDFAAVVDELPARGPKLIVVLAGITAVAALGYAWVLYSASQQPAAPLITEKSIDALLKEQEKIMTPVVVAPGGTTVAWDGPATGEGVHGSVITGKVKLTTDLNKALLGDKGGIVGAELILDGTEATKLTPEEIVNKVPERVWLNGFDSIPLAVKHIAAPDEADGPYRFEAYGSGKAYIRQGRKGHRVVADVSLLGAINLETKQINGSWQLRYNMPPPSAGDAPENVMESLPDGSYRFLLTGDFSAAIVPPPSPAGAKNNEKDGNSADTKGAAAVNAKNAG